jgi:hypothetical protein
METTQTPSALPEHLVIYKDLSHSVLLSYLKMKEGSFYVPNAFWVIMLGS